MIFIFCFSFFIALLLRLESDYAIFLMESLWVFSILFALLILLFLTIMACIMEYGDMRQCMRLYPFLKVLLFQLFL